MHTASGTFGARPTLGGADFYANGGVIQPGCILQNTSMQTTSSGTILP